MAYVEDHELDEKRLQDVIVLDGLVAGCVVAHYGL